MVVAQTAAAGCTPAGCRPSGPFRPAVARASIGAVASGRGVTGGEYPSRLWVDAAAFAGWRTVTGRTADPVPAELPLRLGGRLGALAALAAAMLIVWAVLRFVPGLSDRIGEIPRSIGAARGAETRAALLTPAAIIVGALLLAWAFRQRIPLGRRAPGIVATALPAGALGVAGAVLLSWAGGAVHLVAAPALHGGAGVLLLGWLLVIWGALGEELMFRGFLQPVLRRAWGTGAALVASAAAFAFLHYLGGWRDAVSLANIFAAGLWFGLLAEKTGGILAPLLAHAGWNGVEALVLGATPNPGLGSYGSLLDIDLVGPALLGGSEDGLNASLTASAMLAILIASLVIAGRIGHGRRISVGAAR